MKNFFESPVECLLFSMPNFQVAQLSLSINTHWILRSPRENTETLEGSSDLPHTKAVHQREEGTIYWTRKPSSESKPNTLQWSRLGHDKRTFFNTRTLPKMHVLTLNALNAIGIVNLFVSVDMYIHTRNH